MGKRILLEDRIELGAWEGLTQVKVHRTTGWRLYRFFRHLQEYPALVFYRLRRGLPFPRFGGKL